MKTLFTALFLLGGVAAYGQTTVTLTEDLVLSETLVISEDTNYEGNGFKIICEGCLPAIRVINGAKASFKDVIFPRNYAKWLQVDVGAGSEASWNSRRMIGFIRAGENE
ncbi:hypothetical protein [Lewinella sp. W8]|uniref:hypothetical protein n=1 Tax=Lewinella sp. W8 TaxID=2528208 RepID=UPI0010679BED|nr:hypothetical protein [Lewinella sp. W8]MTB50617.1 hypothetical protein [Lewinella sp. W8]